ncbi:ABC transporter substrate-binding protein, partial [Amycolatopsis lexingtonensis]
MLAAAGAISLSACSARTDSGSGDSSASSQSQAAAPSAAADAADPAGDGKAQCAPTSIAYAGTINGANAALGVNILNGAKLAVDQHNKANPGCQVKLEQFDTEGTPDKAPGIVTQIVNTPAIIGVVGLPFSGESKAAGNIFNGAGLVTVTPSAT